MVLLLICVSRTQPTQRELFNVRSDFDQAFVSSPAFWWKTLFIALASCVPGACTAPVVLLGRFAHRASHVTHYTSHVRIHVSRHTSHVTRPHTRHTSHVTRHTRCSVPGEGHQAQMQPSNVSKTGVVTRCAAHADSSWRRTALVCIRLVACNFMSKFEPFNVVAYILHDQQQHDPTVFDF